MLPCCSSLPFSSPFLLEPAWVPSTSHGVDGGQDYRMGAFCLSTVWLFPQCLQHWEGAGHQVTGVVLGGFFLKLSDFSFTPANL